MLGARVTVTPASLALPRLGPPMADRQPTTESLRGRRTECALLDELLTAVHGGESRSLVIRGEAGIGKTALIQYAVAAAGDLLLVRASGVESEMELPFAALHQLCAPLLGHLDRLPAPQHEALRIVFGLSPGAPPDRFLIGLAVLSLLSETATERPTLCIVDDVHWLDRASAQAFGFVARRLRVESVGMIFATRESNQDLRGLPELELEGLRDGDARALLGSVVTFLLDEPVRQRIMAETRGNPLALLELPRGLSPMQLAGGFGLLTAQGLSGRIEESFQRRLAALPTDSRSLLLVAAAEPLGDPLLVWGAAEQLGIGASAAAAAESEGFLAIRDRVTFRHPLVRSAVYRSASAQERQAVHLALAAVTDPAADPDRRAWHRAAAAPAPDERVAAELERSAGRAQARGGFSAAAAFLQRSVALTEEPARRTGRALVAAQASLRAGLFDVALELLAVAEAGSLDELQGARVDLLRGQIAFAATVSSDAPLLLLTAARRLEALDLPLARVTYLNAWGAAAFAGPAGADDLLKISRASAALPSADHPRAVDVLLTGLALLITDGRTAAAPHLHQATRSFADGEVSVEDGLRWGWVATAATNALWDYEGSYAICERQIEHLRASGALERLPVYLVTLATAVASRGDFAAAEAISAEADEVTAATGALIGSYTAVLLAGLRGDELLASALIDAALEQDADGGQGIAVTHAQWVSAMLYNGLGRYDKALAAAQSASADPLLLYASMWALPELVEAAVHVGRVELARDALDRLAETTQPSGTEFGLGMEARSRALLSDGETADELFLEAIDRLGRTELRPELARAHLLYGEWLRREGQRTQAREHLRTAHDLFDAIGMAAFAERARHELLATGERVRKRTVASRGEFTAQEQQIARLAGDGLSNPEIGSRLFISSRTVEWHLHKVFAKLGISSRRALHDALDERAS
ncbi:LuxR family transcriptional regulator [Acidothermaceae bacterium B102]|nr:LuxR family transcriptional regulator [Acidothermaceae bacterium B102]